MQNWSWLLDQSASTVGPQLDRLYYWILVITGIVFVGTELALIWFLIKYRHREGRKAAFIHGNTKAEIIWTVIPAVIVLSIALASRGLWAQVKDPEEFPPNSMPVLITAKQFEWNVTYPGPDGEIGTGDDFRSRNRLDIPLDRPTRLILHSEDVIHSFFVPLFRLKQDVVPGMETHMWFQPTRTGEFPIGCAELCGIGHTRMRGTLTVHSATDYQAWVNTQLQTAQPAAQPAAAPAP
jgi:cytochrome c oxidase subunit II